MWTQGERKFLKGLRSPDGIQAYLDSLPYNPVGATLSPRYVMMSGDAHCLEGGLLAAAALELMGHRPLLVELQANDYDDSHMIAVYKTQTGWGSIAKSNTTLLAGRYPVYRSIRELVMSYFDFYFNIKGRPSLYAYSPAVDLNRFNDLEWRTGDNDLIKIGYAFNHIPHTELISLRELGRLKKAPKRVQDACFLGFDPDGVFKG
jgi:hypothetical protein